MTKVLKVIKRDGREVNFDKQKIINAITKAGGKKAIAYKIAKKIERLKFKQTPTVRDIEKKVVNLLINEGYKVVAIKYEGYRAIQEYKRMLNKRNESTRILNQQTRENANKNSELIATKKGLILDMYITDEMLNNELPKHLAKAHKNNDIKFHDVSDRYFKGINCCLFDMKNVIDNNPIINGLKYDDATCIEAYLGVLSDVLLEASANQYGGFTINEIDYVLESALENAYNKSIKYYTDELGDLVPKKRIEELAMKFVERAFRKRWNGIETRLNSISNSNMQVPFETIAFGNRTGFWAKMVSRIILETRIKGCGKYRQTAIFPKLVFFYRDEIHGKGGINEDLYNLAIECRSKREYPDFLSLDAGWCGEVWKKYGYALAPMGCVDGQEIITYKYNKNLYVESFERMWNRLSKKFIIKEQELKGNYFITPIDVQIFDFKNGFVNVKRVIKNKDKGDWTRVKFSNGRSLLATEDHPLPIISKGRTFIKDLNIGDEVVINQNQHSEEKYRFDEELAWLQGFILCDGCYDKQFSVSIAESGEDDIEERYKDIIKQYFNLNTETIVWHRGKRGNYKEIRCRDFDKLHIQENFTLLFGGLQKKYRHIPSEVFSYNKKAKLSFLAGMIDADGYINSQRTGSIVQLGSTNKELALQTMALAQSLGYPAKIYLNHYTSKDKNKIRYRVEFSATVELMKYITCQKKINHFNKESNITRTDIAQVTSIEVLGYLDKYSYDVTTESDFFDVSGIYSHNCRAYLSPWFEKGGIKPLDKDDKAIFNGRANCGAITINTVKPAIKFKGDKEAYFKEVKRCFDLATEGHLWTYNRMKDVKASTNPLFFCEGGCHIKLKPDETIEKAIKTFTWSYGYIGLNEASLLMTGKEIHEDNSFAIEVLEHFNKWKNEAIKKYGLLFAIYSTPAEGYAETCRNKDFAEFGSIPGVTDKKYYMNSFHVNVAAKVNPFKKMEIEKPMFDLANGGHIVYTEYPINHNLEAISQTTRKAMKLGLYEGVNFDSITCKNCGKTVINYDPNNPKCDHCGSTKLIIVDRVCGYLSYYEIDGDTRVNDAKYQENQHRVVHYGQYIGEGIQDFDVLNGEGLRTTIWFKGCPHRCEGCHNQGSWDYDKNYHINADLVVETCKKSKKLSVLGGEPLAPFNINEATEIVKKVKREIPDCSIYLWTGYEWDDVKNKEIIQYLDRIKCGKFIKADKCDNPMYGSSNQYIIDIQ